MNTPPPHRRHPRHHALTEAGDARAVVADGAMHAAGLRSSKVGDRATPAPADHADRSSLCREIDAGLQIGQQHLLGDGTEAGQAAGNIRVAEHETRFDPVKKTWRDGQPALGGIFVSLVADVAVAAEYLLQQHDCAARAAIRSRNVGLESVVVARRQYLDGTCGMHGRGGHDQSLNSLRATWRRWISLAPPPIWPWRRYR